MRRDSIHAVRDGGADSEKDSMNAVRTGKR